MKLGAVVNFEAHCEFKGHRHGDEPSAIFSLMTRRAPDARTAAEKAFKAATTKPVEGPPRAAAALPGVKETVSLRIDGDVLDFFQEDGPGWQDRINAALRRAAGK